MSLPNSSSSGNFYGNQSSPDGSNAGNSGQPGANAGKGKRIGIIAGSSVLALGLLAGGAYAVTNGFNSVTDKDIAQVMPASTAIFGEIDLNPSNEQKIGVVSAAQKFKDLSDDKDIDPNKDPKEILTDGYFKDLDFETEVKPWVGDKVALGSWGDYSSLSKDNLSKNPLSGSDDYSEGSYANEATLEDYNTYSQGDPIDSYEEDVMVGDYSGDEFTYTENPPVEELPEESSESSISIDRASLTVASEPQEDGVHNVIIYEIKDKKKAQEAAEKAFADKEEKFLVTNDYLIIAENQEDIDAYSKLIEEGNLAEQENFKNDRKAFNQDAIATGWADLGKFDLGSSAKEYYGNLETKDGAPFKVEGRVISGLSLEQGKATSVTKVVEVTSNAFDTTTVDPGAVKDIGNLPASTFGAVALSGLDEGAKKAWEQNRESIENSSDFASTQEALESQYGISLPDDFTKILGSETVIGVGESAVKGEYSSSADFAGYLRLTGADTGLFEDLLASSGAGAMVEVGEEDGVTTLSYNGENSDEKLGDTDKFKKSVGNIEKSHAVGYADLDKIAELSGEPAEEGKSLGTVGLNSVFDKDKNVSTVTVNWVY